MIAPTSGAAAAAAGTPSLANGAKPRPTAPDNWGITGAGAAEGAGAAAAAGAGATAATGAGAVAAAIALCVGGATAGGAALD